MSKKTKRKKNSGSYFIIELKIYPFNVMVSIDEADKTLFKRLKGYGNTKDDCEGAMNLPSTTLGRAVILPSNQTVIRLRTLKNKHKMMSVIAHEIFHATTFILERVGMKLELGVSCEAYAYLLGFLTKEIYKKLKI